VFNIGSGRSRSILDIGRMLAAAMDRDDLQPRLLGRARAGDIRHCLADISRAADRLGFAPTRQLEDSLLDLVAWISDQKARDDVPKALSELQERGLVV
jgi:dTDP-L-rhamnose 4-epimerase